VCYLSFIVYLTSHVAAKSSHRGIKVGPDCVVLRCRRQYGEQAGTVMIDSEVAATAPAGVSCRPSVDQIICPLGPLCSLSTKAQAHASLAMTKPVYLNRPAINRPVADQTVTICELEGCTHVGSHFYKSTSPNGRRSEMPGVGRRSALQLHSTILQLIDTVKCLAITLLDWQANLDR